MNLSQTIGFVAGMVAHVNGETPEMAMRRPIQELMTVARMMDMSGQTPPQASSLEQQFEAAIEELNDDSNTAN